MDIGRVKSIIKSGEQDFLASEILASALTKDSLGWGAVYKLKYDALHELAEAFLLSKKLKSTNHLCLFALVCAECSNLNWTFLETIRTKRNGLNYYGECINYNEYILLDAEFRNHFEKLKVLILEQLNIEQ
jgi:hypothetical protein